jgi:hypothetical protein
MPWNAPREITTLGKINYKEKSMKKKPTDIQEKNIIQLNFATRDAEHKVATAILAAKRSTIPLLLLENQGMNEIKSQTIVTIVTNLLITYIEQPV